MTPWSVRVTATAPDGNLTQLYPDFCTAGAAAGTQGELVRRPTEGTIGELTVSGDGTNAGTIELYDMDGNSEGADVDSAATITNANLVAALAASPPRAKLIKKVKIAGTDQLTVVRAGSAGTPCMKGLVARFSMSQPTGTVDININSTGLFQKYERHV